jgi:LytS/YehU family sensor histidine kinase
MNAALRPLSEGNRFQRWYAAWAAPYYARMPAEARASAELLDRFLYSRRGLGVWIGLACALAGSSAGLHGAGMPWWLAILLSLVFWFLLPVIGLTAWLVPDSVLGRKPLKKYLMVAGLSVLGALLGFAVGHVAKRGSLDWTELGGALARNIDVLAPVVVLVICGVAFLMWGIAHVRRGILHQELERASLAREAAEARLKLLQGQIQPHFIFNTLSALQHWVDTGDARASALLRSLTAFLRGSTELLGRDETSVADEAALVAHYLAIQQARLGERLATRIEIAPEVGSQALPPGVLLTLVENAIEHGIGPSLSGGEVAVIGAGDNTGWTLAVRDDGVGLAAAARDGVGLANSRARLQHRFGARASLQLRAQGRGTEAMIRVEGAAS